jgi:hypothetical protein
MVFNSTNVLVNVGENLMIEDKNIPSIPYDDFSSSKDIDHSGYCRDRIENHPLEAHYANEWKKMNDVCSTLGYLLSPGSNECDWDEVSVRDVRVAATIIQWLGSNSGQAFLSDCEKGKS